MHETTSRVPLTELLAELQQANGRKHGVVRRELEGRLRPLVRQALNGQTSISWLVDWVRDTTRALAAPGRTSGQGELEDRLCRRLSYWMVDRVVRSPGLGSPSLETLIGP